jgi:hypothetical protein
MNQEETLRKALEGLCKAVWFGTDDDRQTAYDKAQLALASVPEQTEMERLKAMVQEMRDDAYDNLEITGDIPGPWTRGYLAALERMLARIEPGSSDDDGPTDSGLSLELEEARTEFRSDGERWGWMKEE